MATVLIMEDDALARELLVRLLTCEGHRPIAYADAAPALEAVDFDTIDLIITDLHMPLRGDAAIQLLRARGIATPIILLSGYLEGGEDERLLALGASWILAKPYEIEVLLEAVRELLVPEGRPA